MRRSGFPTTLLTSLALLLAPVNALCDAARQPDIKHSCTQCHKDGTEEGGFNLKQLGSHPTDETFDLWLSAVRLVKSGEMPPEDKKPISDDRRERIVDFLKTGLSDYIQDPATMAKMQAGTLNQEGAQLSPHPFITLHCYECHNDSKAKGEFNLKEMGTEITPETARRWFEVRKLIVDGEMPPPDEGELSSADKKTMVTFLENNLRNHMKKPRRATKKTSIRRLNNREFANAVRDALLLPGMGTHEPMSNLMADGRHHGFDTHADTLGFSRYQLEQYLASVRKMIDSTVFDGKKPNSNLVTIRPGQFKTERLMGDGRTYIKGGQNGYIDIAQPQRKYFIDGFESLQEAGPYKIRIRAAGIDRNLYPSKSTGFHRQDRIQLRLHLGDVKQTFDLPDGKETVIEVERWLDAGTKIQIENPTDAFALQGNGNFINQWKIVKDHLEKTNIKLHNQLLDKDYARMRDKFMKEWRGARPRVYSVEIEGPLHDQWPPERHNNLLGDNPNARQPLPILQPIAERAWRRPVKPGEMNTILELVRKNESKVGPMGALKEGLAAIFISPNFLLMNADDGNLSQRYATKISYFLQSTIPVSSLRRLADSGHLDSFKTVQNVAHKVFDMGKAEIFLREFPYSWLELRGINFMPPDQNYYPVYHRKELSEDMIQEVLHFFRYIVENNRPITEMISADYSFINKDLADLYDVDGFPERSSFEKHTFTDGRRGGLLAMGAFLTTTSDNLFTSPIHRGVYVLKNFLGVHPVPPPADLDIPEPDIRSAKTIRQILKAHESERSCLSCHEKIDPWGYAFENFDPTGAWRDVYAPVDPSGNTKRKNVSDGKGYPIQASAKIYNGGRYTNFKDFRDLMNSPTHSRQFVRCFITKLLTYANGAEPSPLDKAELDRLVDQSARMGYKTVDTIAAVIHSPLFKEHQ